MIIETFRTRGIDPVHVPGVLCASHGPFTWGKDAAQAVYHAVVLEEVAKMALLTCQINPNAEPAPQHVLDQALYAQARPQRLLRPEKVKPVLNLTVRPGWRFLLFTVTAMGKPKT